MQSIVGTQRSLHDQIGTSVSRSSADGQAVWLAEARCEQCDAFMLWEHTDRVRRRFCCSDCLSASAQRRPKERAPHTHLYR